MSVTTDGKLGASRLRAVPDVRRPAVSTVEAARRLNIPRASISALIQAGELDGYGIPGEHRTRWMVYSDVLDEVEEQSSDPRLSKQELNHRHLSLIKSAQVEIRRERDCRLDAAEQARRAIGLYAEAIASIQSVASPELRQFMDMHVEETLEEAAKAERQSATSEIAAQRRANDLGLKFEQLIDNVQLIGGRDGGIGGDSPN